MLSLETHYAGPIYMQAALLSMLIAEILFPLTLVAAAAKLIPREGEEG